MPGVESDIPHRPIPSGAETKLNSRSGLGEVSQEGDDGLGTVDHQVGPIEDRRRRLVAAHRDSHGMGPDRGEVDR